MAGRRAKRFVVGRVDEFEEGQHVVVDVNGRSIGVFRYEGEFYALLNRCPHQGGPLCVGAFGPTIEADGVGGMRLDADRAMVSCPWHGWEFDIRDGQSYCDPGRFRVKAFPVSVEGGEAVSDEIEQGTVATVPGKVKGPFKAETIPVSVEDDYVVVRLR